MQKTYYYHKTQIKGRFPKLQLIRVLGFLNCIIQIINASMSFTLKHACRQPSDESNASRMLGILDLISVARLAG